VPEDAAQNLPLGESSIGNRASRRSSPPPPGGKGDPLRDSPVGVYIHVPFCFKRCPYCAFVLIESDGALHSRFVGVIERQLKEARVDAVTLYFGGGTPSMLEPEQVARLITGGVKEVTLEANPDGL